MSDSFREGVDALKARDFPRAVACLTAAAEADPDDARSRMALGAALGELGRWDEAVAALQSAAVLAPALAAAHYNLGHALERAGRIDEARQAYRQACRLEPNHDRAGEALRRLVDTPLVDQPAWP